MLKPSKLHSAKRKVAVEEFTKIDVHKNKKNRLKNKDVKDIKMNFKGETSTKNGQQNMVITTSL